MRCMEYLRGRNLTVTVTFSLDLEKSGRSDAVGVDGLDALEGKGRGLRWREEEGVVGLEPTDFGAGLLLLLLVEDPGDFGKPKPDIARGGGEDKERDRWDDS